MSAGVFKPYWVIVLLNDMHHFLIPILKLLRRFPPLAARHKLTFYVLFYLGEGCNVTLCARVSVYVCVMRISQMCYSHTVDHSWLI